jgi:hypothetical protein
MRGFEESDHVVESPKSVRCHDHRLGWLEGANQVRVGFTIGEWAEEATWELDHNAFSSTANGFYPRQDVL